LHLLGKFGVSKREMEGLTEKILNPGNGNESSEGTYCEQFALFTPLADFTDHPLMYLETWSLDRVPEFMKSLLRWERIYLGLDSLINKHRDELGGLKIYLDVCGPARPGESVAKSLLEAYRGNENKKGERMRVCDSMLFFPTIDATESHTDCLTERYLNISARSMFENAQKLPGDSKTSRYVFALLAIKGYLDVDRSGRLVFQDPPKPIRTGGKTPQTKTDQ